MGVILFDGLGPFFYEWDQKVEADLVEGPVERVSREEVVKAIGEMKIGKAAGPSEVSVEMIIASGEIGIGVMMELSQRVLDEKECWRVGGECDGSNF